jgi:hypothetical protein
MKTYFCCRETAGESVETKLETGDVDARDDSLNESVKVTKSSFAALESMDNEIEVPDEDGDDFGGLMVCLSLISRLKS